MKNLLTPEPIFIKQGIGIVRITIGIFLIYHGQEIFHPEIIKGYSEWEIFKGSSGMLMIYAGKSSELVAGVLLFLGLLTRPGAIMIAGTFAYITFFVGQGRFYYEDQHPFMFLLFGVLFSFTGPGAWSLDAVIFKDKTGKP